MAGSRMMGMVRTSPPPILGHGVLRRAEFQGLPDIGSAQVPMDLGKEGMRKTAAFVSDVLWCVQWPSDRKGYGWEGVIF